MSAGCVTTGTFAKSWAARFVCLTVVLVFSLLQLACSSGVVVRSTFDPNAPLQNYRTFAMLLPNRPVATENVDISPFVMQKLRQLTHHELKAKGFSAAPKQSAQLLVSVMAGTKRRVERNATPGYSGYGYGGPGWSYSVDDYLEGTLVIDLIDREKQAVVWRGSGKIRLSEETQDARLAQVVASVLAQFPPPSKNSAPAGSSAPSTGTTP